MKRGTKQKFYRYDLVRVADDLGKTMSHFPGAGELAVVEGSYADLCHGSDRKSFGLMFEKHGGVSWYNESQLTLIETGRVDLYEKWEN